MTLLVAAATATHPSVRANITAVPKSRLMVEGMLPLALRAEVRGPTGHHRAGQRGAASGTSRVPFSPDVRQPGSLARDEVVSLHRFAQDLSHRAEQAASFVLGQGLDPPPGLD